MSNLAIKNQPPSMEDTIREGMMVVINSAKALIVADDVSYQNAAGTLKLISERKKQVQEYWKGPKDSASKAHKDICAKEKAMISPLVDAESLLKRSMGEYTMKVEAQRKAAAAELERKQKEERERLLAEAVLAEQSGDVVAAETSLIMAEIVDDMRPASVSVSVPKAAGISMRKAWKARVLDDSKVPTHIAGVCIRPVNMSALNDLARMTKGTAQIPGVEFYEDTSLSVR